MKSQLSLLFLLSSLAMSSQDIIVKNDGSAILSKVIKVGTTEIEYKKFSNQNGPTYTVLKTDVMAINYENGEKDVFSVESDSGKGTNTSQDDSSTPQLINKEPDARNAEIISLYNHDINPTKKIDKSNESAKACFTIWRLSPSSVVSNEDMEICFKRGIYTVYHSDVIKMSGRKDGAFYLMFTYHINITNKTDKTVYIDKGNCFRIIDDGSAFCYYNPSEQTTVSHGSTTGASIGIGSVFGVLGIGGVVGGSTSNSVSTTYSQQRFIAIPPHGNCNLTNFKRMEKYPYKIIENVEFFATKTSNNPPKRGVVKKGEVLTYDAKNSPWKKKYIITYSTDSNFKTYSTIQAEIYLYKMIGTKYFAIVPSKLFFNPEKYLNGVTNNTIIDWDLLEE